MSGSARHDVRAFPHGSGSGPGRGARQSSLRSLNLATVIRHVYASDPPPSRADVAAATGMTRSTVSRLVDELIDQGLLAELDPVVDGQRGRPAVPLVAARGTVMALGLEVNVSHLAARVADLAGTVISERIVTGSYRGASPKDVFREVARLGLECLAEIPAEASVAGVQLALPGLVDAAGSILLRAPNLGWSGVKPRGLLVAGGLDLTGIAFGVGNEADFAAFTVAQAAPGRPSGVDEFLYVSGEVGIGSAVVTHGDVMAGRHGWAGEIGHVCVDAAGPLCACGARGCLECFAGQQALVDAAGVADRAALSAALAAGDPTALATMQPAATALGIALSGALNMLDVSLVVLGGHLGELAEYLAPTVRQELRVRVLAAPFAEPQVETVSLDPAPAALGAAYAGLNGVLRSPASWLDRLG